MLSPMDSRALPIILILGMLNSSILCPLPLQQQNFMMIQRYFAMDNNANGGSSHFTQCSIRYSQDNTNYNSLPPTKAIVLRKLIKAEPIYSNCNKNIALLGGCGIRNVCRSAPTRRSTLD